MKIALVHDFLIRFGGAESVFLDLKKIFPEADIFTLFYKKKFTDKYLPGTKLKTSFLQRRYSFLEKIISGGVFHRALLPWMPQATEDLDFSGYDLVLSSSSGFVKGIVVPSKAKHICYLHTPTRWAWQNYSERLGSGKSAIKRGYAHFFRIWDYEASQRPDTIITNSRYTSLRIKKYYRRNAKVVYPTIELPTKKLDGLEKNLGLYFVMVGRLSDYKHIDWAIEALRNTKYKLVIIGDGPEYKNLKLEKKVILKGHIEDRRELMSLVKNSVGLIHLAEEDFGLCVLEAQSLGVPTIVLDKGGAKEISKKNINNYIIAGDSKDQAIENLRYLIKNTHLRKHKIMNQNNLNFLTFKRQILKIVNEKS